MYLSCKDMNYFIYREYANYSIIEDGLLSLAVARSRLFIRANFPFAFVLHFNRPIIRCSLNAEKDGSPSFFFSSYPLCINYSLVASSNKFRFFGLRERESWKKKECLQTHFNKKKNANNIERDQGVVYVAHFWSVDFSFQKIELMPWVNLTKLLRNYSMNRSVMQRVFGFCRRDRECAMLII